MKCEAENEFDRRHNGFRSSLVLHVGSNRVTTLSPQPFWLKVHIGQLQSCRPFVNEKDPFMTMFGDIV